MGNTRLSNLVIGLTGDAGGLIKAFDKAGQSIDGVTAEASRAQQALDKLDARSEKFSQSEDRRLRAESFRQRHYERTGQASTRGAAATGVVPRSSRAIDEYGLAPDVGRAIRNSQTANVYDLAPVKVVQPPPAVLMRSGASRFDNAEPLRERHHSIVSGRLGGFAASDYAEARGGGAMSPLAQLAAARMAAVPAAAAMPKVPSAAAGAASSLSGSLMTGLGIGSGAAIATAGLKAISAAAEATFSQLKHGFDMSAELEQTRISLETMLGSVEKANVLMGQVEAFAVRTPFKFPELANTTKMLLAYGVAQEDVLPTMTKLGDMAAGLSIPLGELADLYGKMRIQGTLYSEDINQLTGRGINVIPELAKQLGVADSEVKKMASEGKVSFGMLEKALDSLTGKGSKFGGLMDKQAKSMAGRWSTLSDTVDMGLAKIADTVASKLDLPGIVDGLTLVADRGLGAIGVALDTLLPKIESAYSGFKTFVGYIDGTADNIRNVLGYESAAVDGVRIANEKGQSVNEKGWQGLKGKGSLESKTQIAAREAAEKAAAAKAKEAKFAKNAADSVMKSIEAAAERRSELERALEVDKESGMVEQRKYWDEEEDRKEDLERADKRREERRRRMLTESRENRLVVAGSAEASMLRFAGQYKRLQRFGADTTPQRNPLQPTPVEKTQIDLAKQQLGELREAVTLLQQATGLRLATF